MADTRDLLVRILGDDHSLQQAFTRTERRTKQFESRTQRLGSGLSRAFAAAGITLGTAAAFKGISDAIDAASDLNEQITKSRAIFGDASEEIERWSKTTASAFGVSRTAALEATGTFGNLFRVVDLAPDAASAMSKSLVQLAADLASFNNADPSDVLIALRSGLIGEAEPLRRFGVLLSEARVQQAAMAATGKTNAKELTNQEKAVARYNIILEDTATAQGDFARTSEGLANQSRILRAQLADVSAELGTKLLPAMVKVVSATNDLVDAFTQAGDELDPRLGESIQDLDVSALIAVRDRLREIGDDGDRDIAILTELIEVLQRVSVPPRPDDRSGVRGPGAIAASNRRVDQAAADRAAAEARADLERSRKRFSSFVKGLGLKLDKAGLTATLNDDIAVLDEIERAIQRQIKREGRTFDLVDQLTSVRTQRAALVSQRASAAADAQRDAAQRQREAFDRIIEGLRLRLDEALDTPGLRDDLRALRKLEQAIKDRIAAEGRTVDLLRQLNEVRQQRERVLEEQRERNRERRQARQFEALGLTETGEQRTPSSSALKKRLGTLREQIKGTSLDTEQTRTQLQRIAKVLSGQFGKVGEDVRKAILEMFRNISDALKTGDRSAAAGGEITPGGIKQIDNLVKGLGLTDEQIAAIHARNQQIRRRPRSSAFGFGLEPSGGGRTSTTNVPHGAARDDVNIHVHVELDGKEIANSTIRHAQKQGNRRAPARRGRHGGRNLGLG